MTAPSCGTPAEPTTHGSLRKWARDPKKKPPARALSAADTGPPSLRLLRPRPASGLPRDLGPAFQGFVYNSRKDEITKKNCLSAYRTKKNMNKKYFRNPTVREMERSVKL